MISGDNNKIIFHPSVETFKSFRIISMQNNNLVEIGKNFAGGYGLKIDFVFQNDLTVKIGDSCLFGHNINFMLGDFHTIYSTEDNSVINKPKKGINIGNHVWLGKNVTVLKDSGVGDNSVVALGSIITKSFTRNNVVLAGSPARVVKENVNWDNANT